MSIERTSADHTVSLQPGRELLTRYKGDGETTRALVENLAEARSLTSADFDEDGVPDLVSGYAYASRGIVTVHRGNADSIYPNAPEAQQRRATGNFTHAPFLSPALAIETAVAADFIGAGDYDADGHWDIAFASRGGSSLYFMRGDGQGNLAEARIIPLPGAVTAFASGELNRRDGLTDVVLGIAGNDGSEVLVYEGPNGVLNSVPEKLSMSSPVTALALGQLDAHFCSDLAVASGRELVFVYGRDRKLSLNQEQQSSVPEARRESRTFAAPVASLVLGDFAGSDGTDVALLLKDGTINLLDGGIARDPNTNREHSHLTDWELTTIAGSYSGFLTRTQVSSFAKDDLLVSNFAQHLFQIVSAGSNARKTPEQIITTMNSDSAPVAVLPMRLDPDALSDLVVLTNGKSSPAIVTTGRATYEPTAPDIPAFDTFSNSTPINIAANSASPPKPATPYPSNISVSGVAGNITKLRVRLNGASFSSFEQDIDLLLVGPTGQKVLLMSDVDTSCVISNATLTFDDDATTSLGGSNCMTGTYKPTDNAPADTFAAPAPAGPYQTTLSAFNGTDPNGTWSLYMVDDVGVFSIPHSIAGGWTLYIGPDSPSTFVVTNTNASGPGSLNQAVLDSNNHLGVDNITFNIPGQAPLTINPTLLSVIDPVNIDATTQPNGVAGQPSIELGGGFFFIEGGRTTIRGFVMNQTSGTNILIRRNGNNFIEGNYLGTNVSGLSAAGPQGGNGVEIDTANNVVGGTVFAARNIIGNKTHAIMFATFDDAATPDDDAANNLIQGNYIGVNADGSAIIPMTHAGVTWRSAPGSPNNTVGGTTAGARNIISGGSFPSGVDIVYSGSNGNLVQGNFIGTDPTGTRSFGSSLNSGNNQGVNIEGGTFNNLIGGTTPAARNVISGNSFAGVFYRDNATQSNLVQGNFIGTDVTGTLPIANGVGVQMIFDASLNTIGGSVAGARNIISGNRIAGLQFGEPTRGGALNNVVQGNYIGTDVTGATAVPNGRTPFFDDAGIIIPANSRGDRIVENRIAYNKGHGIRITNVSGGDINSIEIEIADNLIYGNEGLGIDLGPSGITPNDPLDADDGPNRLQNFPVLNSAVPVALSEPPGLGDSGPTATTTLTVNGTLNSAPNTSYTVHWYFSNDPVCTTNQAATQPLATGRVPGITTDSNGNASFSFPFDFPPGTTGGIINCTAADSLGNTSEFSACFSLGSAATPTPTPTPSVKLSASSYAVGESVGSAQVVVQRSGSTAAAASVKYATSDTAGTSNCNTLNSGVANSRCDYETTSGTLNFVAGEASKTILIPIIDDVYAEGAESLTMTLSSAAGTSLGSPSVATINITDNDSSTGTNPINNAAFFVRLHYVDFFTREPDPGGQAFWTDQITSCGTDQACVELRRINVSAAFYLSIEFQDTGYLVYRFYKAAYGNIPNGPVPVRFSEFLPDTQQIGQGVVVGQSGWEQVLENNKVAFAAEFVTRSRFTGAYATSQTPAQFVDALFLNAGVTPSSTDRTAAINEFAGAGNTSNTAARGRALRRVAENSLLRDQEKNRAFVLMQYFGYLRRNPYDPPEVGLDFGGYNFWLGKLNQFNGNFVNAEMVKAFIVSGEYKTRFGP